MERPILFRPVMARAVIDDRKTQTRRIVKPQPTIGDKGEIKFPWAAFFNNGHVHTFDEDGTGGENWDSSRYQEDKFLEALKRTPHSSPCPYGKPENKLWVRETWTQGRALMGGDRIYYKADEGTSRCEWMTWSMEKWKPSIHMPRWACRLVLEITKVRVERLQEISEEDAKAEGAIYHNGGGIGHSGYRHDPHEGLVWDTARESFLHFWDTFKRSEETTVQANPWVWVIEFKKVEV